MYLILCPLALELKFLKQKLKTLGLSFEQDQVDGQTCWRSSRVTLAVGGHGKVQYALTSAQLIDKLNPEALLCVGAAGALTENLPLGTIIVGEQTIEHDYKQKFDPNAAKPLFIASVDLVHKIMGRSGNVIFGIIVSGDEDIVCPERARELHEATQAMAVAWEGAGGARAAQMHGTPFVEMRAITDHANKNAVSDFKENLKLGMDQLGDVIGAMIIDE